MERIEVWQSFDNLWWRVSLCNENGDPVLELLRTRSYEEAAAFALKECTRLELFDCFVRDQFGEYQSL